MNATNLAESAYASSANPIRTDRGAEYSTFARITRQLKISNPKNDFPKFAKALHDNRQLWTLLAVDVADQSNGLPQKLRAQIFYLAEFTQIHTSKALSGVVGPDALIAINTAVMQGLRQKGETK